MHLNQIYQKRKIKNLVKKIIILKLLILDALSQI